MSATTQPVGAPDASDIFNKIQEGYQEARKVNAQAVATQLAINGSISVSQPTRPKAASTLTLRSS